jgi:hypothetical protein
MKNSLLLIIFRSPVLVVSYIKLESPIWKGRPVDRIILNDICLLPFLGIDLYKGGKVYGSERIIVDVEVHSSRKCGRPFNVTSSLS